MFLFFYARFIRVAPDDRLPPPPTEDRTNDDSETVGTAPVGRSENGDQSTVIIVALINNTNYPLLMLSDVK